MICFACPSCDSAVCFDPNDAGTHSVCPNCRAQILVPATVADAETIAQLVEQCRRETKVRENRDTRTD